MELKIFRPCYHVMISESQKYSDISLFVITESTIIIKYFHLSTTPARLAQSVEHETLNLRVVGSSPTLGVIFLVLGWNILKIFGQKCRDPGSNRGPLDLQSNALPTELSRQQMPWVGATSNRCFFPSWSQNKSWIGSTEIWTRIAGFRVQSANHYTMEPFLCQ